MADYYPLLAKAVAGLPNSTPEARRAIYERARKALYGQLRSLEPPVPETVVEREARALEEAVARLEVEIALEAPGEAEAEPERPAPAPEPPPPAPEPPPAALIAEDQAGPAAGPTGIDAVRPFEDALSAVAEDAPVPRPAPAGLARKETRRPTVPVPVRQAAVPRRLWIVGAAVGVVVVLVAILAYALRDRPEDVARPLSPSPSSLDDTVAAGGKIVDRIGSGETRPVEPQPPAVKRDEPARTNVLPAEPLAAVARRAALLVEAPEDQAKVKTYLGTVVWRIDNVSNGPGEPLGTAVRAEIDIPEEKLQAVMTFQKNVDSALPASHTMKLRFVLPPGGLLGSVKHINVPHMRREDTATGDPLNGVPVPVMENSFLVGLAKGTAEATNLDLLRSREWIDVPLLFANGRIAKLTFEKGTSGQRALEDAIASWQAP